MNEFVNDFSAFRLGVAIVFFEKGVIPSLLMDEKAPETIEMNEEEFGAFKKRLEADSLSSDDKKLILQLFMAMQWLNRQLEHGKLTITRLKRLIFGKKTESRENILGSDAGTDKSEGALSEKPDE